MATSEDFTATAGEVGDYRLMGEWLVANGVDPNVCRSVAVRTDAEGPRLELVLFERDGNGSQYVGDDGEVVTYPVARRLRVNVPDDLRASWQPG